MSFHKVEVEPPIMLKMPDVQEPYSVVTLNPLVDQYQTLLALAVHAFPEGKGSASLPEGGITELQAASSTARRVAIRPNSADSASVVITPDGDERARMISFGSGTAFPHTLLVCRRPVDEEGKPIENQREVVRMIVYRESGLGSHEAEAPRELQPA